jgi:hypothetical protein
MQTIQIVKQSASYYLRVTLGEVEGLTTRMLRGSREGVASRVAASGIHRLANALHLLPNRVSAVDCRHKARLAAANPDRRHLDRPELQTRTARR